MRYLFVLLIYSLIHIQLFAQSFFPTIPDFPAGDSFFKRIYVQLILHEEQNEDSINTGELFLYSYVPDTIIGPNKYKVFQELIYNGYDECWKPYFFRQENDKVYRFFDDIKQDMLVYDFSTSIGDTITRKNGERMKVVSIKTASDYPLFVKEHGAERKWIHLQSIDNHTVTDDWIEGTGSVYTGLLEKSDFKADETFVESMYCKNSPDIQEGEILRITHNKDYLKSMAGTGVNTDSSDEDKYNAIRDGNDSFIMEFIDDTLHVVGFTYLFIPEFVANAWITGNDVNLFIDNVYESRWPVLGFGNLYKIDLSFPGFNTGTYNILYWDPLHSERQTLFCKNQNPKGDINSDGNVDINDVVCIINHMAGTASWSKADVNSDKVTDINDVVSVINIMAGKSGEVRFSKDLRREG